MSRQFWLFLSLTNSEWNKIDYNRNVAWQEDILTESNDLSTKDCNGKTKKQITRSVRRLQSYFQITVTIFTLDYVNINFPSQYNRQNNPKSYPSLTRDLRFVLFTLFSDLLLILHTPHSALRKIIITCTRLASEYFYMVYYFDLNSFIIHDGVCLQCGVARWQGGIAVGVAGWITSIIQQSEVKYLISLFSDPIKDNFCHFSCRTGNL